MREFNLDLLIGKKVAVNCKTKAEEEEFLQYLDSRYIKWNGGDYILNYEYYSYNEYESETCFTLGYKVGLQYSPIIFFKEQNYKILTLDDLVIKPKNNFKVYGFVADFEVKILAVKDDKYFGISKMNESEGWVANGWKKDGTCLYDDVSHLKPIKKEWYKNPDIAEKLLKAENPQTGLNELCIFKHKGDCTITAIGLDGKEFIGFFSTFRPATKEEVLTLLVKEQK